MVGLRYRRIRRVSFTDGKKSIVHARVVAGFQNVSAKNRNARVVRSRSADSDPDAAATLHIFQTVAFKRDRHRNQIGKNDERILRERKAGSLLGTRGINREARFSRRSKRRTEIYGRARV